jgi:peroxiredoxin Q/BCP
MLQVDDRAPDFLLPDADMQMRGLSDFSDRILVLYFYPKDDTPGCTLQATEFSELVEAFEEAGAHVVGISRDDCFSHQFFRDKFGLKIPLLADVEGEACSSYGVLQDKEKHGIRVTSIIRSTFVIDRGGTIRYARYGVSPGRHAAEILALVKSLAQ